MPKTVAVIDGNSLMHRAYHAVPPTMTAPDGTPTNAVFGFISMFLKLIDVAPVDAVVCAFDAGRPKHRMEALEQYKAQRPPMDDELRVQFPLIEALLASMNIPVIKIKGWEGDDILGTVAARNDAIGNETLLITGDKDAYQLASEHTRIVTTKKGITDVAVYGPQQVVERYGITPAQVPDFLGLKGDPSDNIPGVPGIGEKTAAKLLQQFETLEGLYDNLDKLKGKQLENVRDNKDAAFLSRTVATIVCDLDFPLDLDTIGFPDFDPATVSDAFGKLHFTSHLSKVLALAGQTVQHEPIQLQWSEYVSDTAADALVRQAMEANTPVAIACERPAQESLFEPGLLLAVASNEGMAWFEGAHAEQTLAHIVGGASFAALDCKAVMQEVYPADTAKPASVDAAALVASRSFDVGLAAYLLESGREDYSVAGLAETYLDGALPEGDQSETLRIQAACVLRLQEVLRAALEKDGSVDVFDDIDMPLVSVLALMERTGAAIDASTLAELGTRTQADIDAYVDKIHALAGQEFNIDSPKQVGHILFEVVGLKPLKKTSRGYSTDAKVLKELAKEHELPSLILKYRELAKIKSTYIDALPKMRAQDGRLHTSFNQTVTTTGRLSSSDPNLQNIPVRTQFGRHIRECFVPLVKGDEFVSADYSQIELRLLAHLSGDEHLVAAFNSGADFHAATAARVFDVPVEEVTPQLRSRAKAVNFGIVYGQQAFGLSQSLDIPFGEAKEMIDRYFEAYPGVRRYLDDVVVSARECGYAVTMFGRKRHIPEIAAHNANLRGFGERTAMNHPMQGSAADIIKIAMNRVQRRLLNEYPQAQLMIQVHDELDLSVPASDVKDVAAMLTEEMEQVVQLSVPLLVDVSHGATWAEAH